MASKSVNLKFNTSHLKEYVECVQNVHQGEIFSDLIFCCKDKVALSAHQNILGQLSPTLLFPFFKENYYVERIMVVLPDIDAEDLEQVLQFLYCGAIKNVKGAEFEEIVNVLGLELPQESLQFEEDTKNDSDVLMIDQTEKHLRKHITSDEAASDSHEEPNDVQDDNDFNYRDISDESNLSSHENDNESSKLLLSHSASKVSYHVKCTPDNDSLRDCEQKNSESMKSNEWEDYQKFLTFKKICYLCHKSFSNDKDYRNLNIHLSMSHFQNKLKLIKENIIGKKCCDHCSYETNNPNYMIEHVLFNHKMFENILHPAVADILFEKNREKKKAKRKEFLAKDINNNYYFCFLCHDKAFQEAFDLRCHLAGTHFKNEVINSGFDETLDKCQLCDFNPGMSVTDSANTNSKLLLTHFAFTHCKIDDMINDQCYLQFIEKSEHKDVGVSKQKKRNIETYQEVFTDSSNEITAPLVSMDTASMASIDTDPLVRMDTSDLNDSTLQISNVELSMATNSTSSNKAVSSFRQETIDKICYVCHEPFRTKKALKTHLIKLHFINNIKRAGYQLEGLENCPICKCFIDDPDHMLRHVAFVHEVAKSFLPEEIHDILFQKQFDQKAITLKMRCYICNLSCDSMKKLRSHILFSHFIKTVKKSVGEVRDNMCRICEKVYSGSHKRFQMWMHISYGHGRIKEFLPKDVYELISVGNVKRAIPGKSEVIGQESKIKAQLCTEKSTIELPKILPKFKSIENMKESFLNKKCIICDKSIKYLHTLKSHTISHYQSILKARYDYDCTTVCPHCNKHMYDVQETWRHVVIRHGIGKDIIPGVLMELLRMDSNGKPMYVSEISPAEAFLKHRKETPGPSYSHISTVSNVEINEGITDLVGVHDNTDNNLCDFQITNDVKVIVEMEAQPDITKKFKLPLTENWLLDLKKAYSKKTCPECNDSFASIYGLKRHVINTHFKSLLQETGITFDSTICPYCDAPQKKAQKLWTHIVVKHGIGKDVIPSDLMKFFQMDFRNPTKDLRKKLRSKSQETSREKSGLLGNSSGDISTVTNVEINNCVVEPTRLYGNNSDYSDDLPNTADLHSLIEKSIILETKPNVNEAGKSLSTEDVCDNRSLHSDDIQITDLVEMDTQITDLKEMDDTHALLEIEAQPDMKEKATFLLMENDNHAHNINFREASRTKTCFICNYSFKMLHGLKRHITNSHIKPLLRERGISYDNSNKMCTHCERTPFVTKDDLWMHVVTKHGIGKGIISQVVLNFLKATNVTHLNNAAETFDNTREQSLSENPGPSMKSLNNIASFECRDNAVTNESSAHSNAKILTGLTTGEEEVNSSLILSKYRNKICYICDFKFTKTQSLRMHLASIHYKPLIEQQNITINGTDCKLCPYKSNKPSHLLHHMMMYHSLGKEFLPDVIKPFFLGSRSSKDIKTLQSFKTSLEFLKNMYCFACHRKINSHFNLKIHICSHFMAEIQTELNCDLQSLKSCPYENCIWTASSTIELLPQIIYHISFDHKLAQSFLPPDTLDYFFDENTVQSIVEADSENLLSDIVFIKSDLADISFEDDTVLEYENEDLVMNELDPLEEAESSIVT